MSKKEKKMAIWHFQIGHIVWPTVQKHKNIKFTVIFDEEKQHILTFYELEPVNECMYTSNNYWNVKSIT